MQPTSKMMNTVVVTSFEVELGAGGEHFAAAATTATTTTTTTTTALSSIVVTPSSLSLQPQHFFTSGIHSIFTFLTHKEWVHAMCTCHEWKVHALTSPIRGISISLSLLPAGLIRFTADIPNVLYSSSLLRRHIRRIDCGSANWFFLRYSDITLMTKELVNLEWLECRIRHTKLGVVLGGGGRQNQNLLQVDGNNNINNNNAATATVVQSLILPPRLRHLTIYFTHDCNVEESNRLLATLPSCTQLDTLILGKMLDKVDITPLVSCATLKSLKLDLWYQTYWTEESNSNKSFPADLISATIVHLTKIPKLTSLNINDGLKNDVILSDLFTLPNCTFPCLTLLNLEKCLMQSDTLIHLIKVVPHMQVLNAQKYDPINFASIKGLKDLHTVHFLSKPLGVEQRNTHDYDWNAENSAELLYAQSLASCSSLTTIHFADLRGRWCFESMGAWNCLLTNTPQLTSLSVFGNNFTQHLLYLLSGHEPPATIGEMHTSQQNAYHHMTNTFDTTVLPQPPLTAGSVMRDENADTAAAATTVTPILELLTPSISLPLPISHLSSGRHILGAQCNHLRHLYLHECCLFARSLEELRYFTSLETLELNNTVSEEFSFEQIRMYCHEMEERFFTKKTVDPDDTAAASATSSSSSQSPSCFLSSSSSTSKWRQLRIFSKTLVWDKTGYSCYNIYFEYDREKGIDTIRSEANKELYP